MKYIITPHLGINDIKLGMNETEVHQILGSPETSYEKQDCYDESRLQIFYNNERNIEYLELYKDIPSEITVYLNDLNIFESTKENIDKYINFNYSSSVNKQDSEYPYSLIYKSIDLSLWNDCHPTDFSPEEKLEYPEDYNKSLFPETIGIGIKKYYT